MVLEMPWLGAYDCPAFYQAIATCDKASGATMQAGPEIRGIETIQNSTEAINISHYLHWRCPSADSPSSAM